MADEGYNTHADLRVMSGMDPAIPTDGVITIWVNLIDGMIERYDTSPNTSGAKIIEANRVSVLYWNLKLDVNGGLESMTIVIDPLSDEEKALLSDNDSTGVDSISVNGKRLSEVYGGRR